MSEVKVARKSDDQVASALHQGGNQSIPHIMWERSRQWADEPLFHIGAEGTWKPVTWKQFADDVREIAGALIDYGIKDGDRVSLLSNTRYEWTVCDYAILSLGAINVPVYQTSSEDEIEYILNDSGTRLVILEDDVQKQKLEVILDKIGGIESFIQIDGGKVEGKWDTLENFRKRGADTTAEEISDRAENVPLDHVCTYIYTSGTTGPPKGCIITHRNFVSCSKSVLHSVPGVFTRRDSTLLFLPLAHGFARMVQFISIDSGLQVYYGNIAKLTDELQSSKPTFFISVPRMFEKAYSGVQSKAAANKVGELVFKLATAIAEPVSMARQEKRDIPIQLRLPLAICDKLIYSKVRQALGGNVRYAISGGAPLAPNISFFFNAAGITILEGYGLTETAPASTCNSPDGYKIGTVGKVLPCNEVKITDEGEVIMRGANIFDGYYNHDQKTKEAIVDGWFHSGDIGEFDEDGFLKITGRIKDLIITAGGKNITPTLVEDELKKDRFISQAVMIGDAKPFCTALITLDADEIKGTDRAEVVKEVDHHIQESNKKFGRVEQIKKYKILDKDFTIEDGEITPTLKVKRAKIQEKYKDVIDELYS